MRTRTSTICPCENRSFYRTVLSLLSVLLSFMAGNAQTATWTWVSGDNTGNVAGVYGTKGTPAATNKPGNRDSHSGWKDASGNFWLFGGWDISGKLYNDLWKYNTASGQWTWISGDNTTNNQGVYGIKGIAAAANKPGSRYGQTVWMDASGDFWIFGGYGYDKNGNAGYLNDLWMYNPTTGNWTWESGDNTRNSTGVYGTKGTAAAANKPGGRRYSTGWIDASGNYWIFGGYGYDGAGAFGDLNDLWKYNPTTNQWTWISGDNTRNNAGVYGTKGTAAATNKPGNRDSQSGWIDASGNLWIQGGYNQSAGTDFNDLWKFTSVTILPVRDISLQGSHRNNDNVLLWETLGELNTNRFIIERSPNGADFTPVGQVAAVGTGNNRYTFTDNNAIGTSFYYRIQVQDLDGQVYYSPIITLAGSTDTRISVYPNPATNGVTLRTGNNNLVNTMAKLYDATGRLLGTFRITGQDQYIDLHDITRGILIFRFDNGKTFSMLKE